MLVTIKAKKTGVKSQGDPHSITIGAIVIEVKELTIDIKRELRQSLYKKYPKLEFFKLKTAKG